jgi:cytochrome P450
MLLRFGKVPVVVASSREAAKEILKTHDAVLATRPQTTTFKILSKRGQGIALAPCGDHWRQLRKICNMELLSANHVQSFRAIRENEAARLVQSIASASASVPLVNLSNMLAGYVADASFRAIMGDRLKDREAFIEQLAEGVRLAAGFSLADLYPSSGRRGLRIVRRISKEMNLSSYHLELGGGFVLVCCLGLPILS